MQETSRDVREDPQSSSSPSRDHLLALDLGWSFWRTGCLRGAGFPVNPLNQLRLEHAIEVLQAVQRREAALEAARRDAVTYCRHKTAALKGDERRTWRRWRRGLGNLRPVVPPTTNDADFDALCAQVRTAQAALDDRSSEYDRAFTAESAGIERKVVQLFREPRYREALAWQNRPLLKRIAALEKPASTIRKSRRRDLTLTLLHYWYRYRTKNESIGFFGPVSWAEIATSDEGLRVRPGHHLVAYRDIQFEYWALRTVCDTFNHVAALKPWLRPKRSAKTRLAGDVLVTMRRERVNLNGTVGAILKACDGNRSAHAIAAEMIALGFTDSDAQTFAILAQCERAGYIDWCVALPVSRQAETTLHAVVDGIGDESLRADISAQWQSIESGIAAIRNLPWHDSGRDPTALSDAMAVLDETFTQLTGASSSRNAGKTYGGRALAYEDCRRDVEVRVGSDLIKSVAEPLALLGSSARWYSWAIAEEFEREVTTEVRAHLAARSGNSAPLAPFLDPMTRLAARVIARQTRALQEKWQSILSLDLTERAVTRSPERLRERIVHDFAAPHPGWPCARFHTPDLMLYRDDIGGYQWVLGEFHAAMNTSVHRSMLSVHPDPASMREQYTQDKLREEYLFTPGLNFDGGYRVAGGVVDGDNDIGIVFGPAPADRAESLSVPIANLRIVDTNGRLKIGNVDDGSLRPIASTFRAVFRLFAMNGFKPVADAEHVPRINLGELVLRRESWRVPAATVPFLDRDRAATRFLKARQWQEAMRFPREIFIRAPLEKKPIHVDFDSALSLDIARRMLRHERDAGNDIVVAEMLPCADDTWLFDAGGNRYTSEFRIPLVDPIPYPAY